MKSPNNCWMFCKFLLHRTNFTKLFCAFAATAIVKISRIQNHVSVVVCQIQKSVFSIWAERRPPSKIFHYAFTWCPMNTNNWAPKLWKPDVFAVTNTWSSTAVRINSTSVCVCIHSTLFVSTRCCRVPELIGMFIFIFFNCIERKNMCACIWCCIWNFYDDIASSTGLWIPWLHITFDILVLIILFYQIFHLPHFYWKYLSFG